MTRVRYFLAIALVVGAVVTTVVAYPHLPSSVPVHWNFHNQIDRYAPKWTLFLLGPGSMVGMIVLFAFLPWLSPKYFEVDTFRATCARIMLIVVALFGYFYAVALWTALGHGIDMGRAILGGICVLFALSGNLMGKVRRNFYIGVRTPWTLANERVWNATHRFAAKTFVVGGLVGLALTIVGQNRAAVFATLLGAALSPVAHSLIYYKRLEHRREI